MARSKRAKATLRAARDEKGRFAKQQESVNFFSLPLEIRSMVYRLCFSWEKPQPATIVHQSRNTLALKLPVLRTSKAVFAEALPIFWQYHMLRIRMARSPRNDPLMIPEIRSIPNLENIDWFARGVSWVGWLAPMKELLTRLELIAPPMATNIEWDAAPGFGYILLNFPNLRVLRLDLTRIAGHGPQDNDLQRLAKPKTRTTDKVIQLWARLDRLEIVMIHYKRDSLEEFREAIGPSSQWAQDITGKGICGCMRSIWSLQRPRESLADAKLAREISATRLTVDIWPPLERENL